MSRNTKSKSADFSLSKLPCRQCMNYLSQDIQQQKDKMEIIYYLQYLSDPKILQKILNLLKNLAQL